MFRLPGLTLLLFFTLAAPLAAGDHVRELQTAAAESNTAAWGHWGPDRSKYSSWGTHSNRLIPVYTFGIGLDAVRGKNSVYRNAAAIERLYGRVPEGTLNAQAEYFDQTDVYPLQKMAADAGKKYIVLIVFDGMDWQTTWAAAIYKAGKVGYHEGRGCGLFFQDYRGAATDFGCCVTAPHNDLTDVDVNSQTVKNPGGRTPGGYDWRLGGQTPWARNVDGQYLIGKNRQRPHPYTDSASAATSLTCGIKTYNDVINVDFEGRQVEPIAQQLQRRGYAIGVLSSVPISHATPACAYANNVHRDDYQDLTRDLLGLPSVAHKSQPLPGVDVLLGGGFGISAKEDKGQGDNFVAGNKYLTAADLETIDAARGGKYIVAQRTGGARGSEVLAAGARAAVEKKQRLLGFFGAVGGHLPFRTADGNYDPTASSANDGPKAAEKYTPADIQENPTLADMTRAALTVLEHDPDGFWLMIESGDVDWANHANNIDNSIGATLSGDDAFRAVADWAERNNRWKDTAVIVTADHGHYLVLERPEVLAPPAQPAGGSR
jgi:alkaline phosphatase